MREIWKRIIGFRQSRRVQKTTPGPWCMKTTTGSRSDGSASGHHHPGHLTQPLQKFWQMRRWKQLSEEPIPTTVQRTASVSASNTPLYPGNSIILPLNGRGSPSPVMRRTVSSPPSKHGRIRCRLWDNYPIFFWWWHEPGMSDKMYSAAISQAARC